MLQTLNFDLCLAFGPADVRRVLRRTDTFPRQYHEMFPFFEWRLLMHDNKSVVAAQS
jgi:hypothetical protein